MGNHKANMRQESGRGLIIIDATSKESQTMVKLCRNGKQWLSPTGWNDSEKSTLLDSQCEGGKTTFTIPENFSSSLNDGDTLSLEINTLDYKGSLVWAATKTAAPMPTSIPATPEQISDSKSGLFGRFRPKVKAPIHEVSEVERLADEARRAAESSDKDMQLAQEAKQAAEARALEAARLAEAANRMEQERAEQAANAKKALKKAEAARTAEEQRLEAERLAEQARLAEIARKAEQARLEKEALRLDEERRAEIKMLSAKLSESTAAISSYKDEASTLQFRADKAKLYLKAQADFEMQAGKSFELAERKLSENETVLTARRSSAQKTADALKLSEKTLSEQQKQADKMAAAAQRALSAQMDAEQAAKAAQVKADELKAAAENAKTEQLGLQRALITSKRQAEDHMSQKTLADTALGDAESTLERVRTSLGDAKQGLETARSNHAEAGNTLRSTDSRITDNNENLQKAEHASAHIKSRIKQLKSQNIAPETVAETAKLLGDKSMPVFKAAALASGMSSVKIMDEIQNAEPKEGALSKLKHMFGKPDDGADEVADIVEAIAKPEAPQQEPKVKLVADNPDLPKSGPVIDETNLDEWEDNSKRNAYIGLSAVLLASVAGISIMAMNGGKTKTVETRVEAQAAVPAQAVLPAMETSSSLPLPAFEDALASEKAAAKETKTAIAKLEVPKVEAPAIIDTHTWGETKAAALGKLPAQVKPIKASVKKIVAKKPVRAKLKPKKAAVKKAPPKPKKDTSQAYAAVTTGMQKQLQGLGFYAGPVSGNLDAETIKSMNEFQSLFGLTKSDKITGELLGELKTASAQAEASRVLDAEIEATKLEAAQKAAEIVINNPPMTAPEIEPQKEASIAPAPVKIELPKEPEIAPDVIVDAKKIYNATPRYPIRANDSGHSDVVVVVVSYDVGPYGDILNPVVKDITGAGRFKSGFERSALKAAKKLQFNPKTINGESVKSEGHTTKYTYNVAE